MKYTEALDCARRVGAAKAEGDAHLAQTIDVLASIHAISREPWYDSARNLGLTGLEVVRMASDHIHRFMMLPWEDGAQPNSLATDESGTES